MLIFKKANMHAYIHIQTPRSCYMQDRCHVCLNVLREYMLIFKKANMHAYIHIQTPRSCYMQDRCHVRRSDVDVVRHGIGCGMQPFDSNTMCTSVQLFVHPHMFVSCMSSYMCRCIPVPLAILFVSAWNCKSLFVCMTVCKREMFRL